MPSYLSHLPRFFETLGSSQNTAAVSKSLALIRKHWPAFHAQSVEGAEARPQKPKKTAEETFGAGVHRLLKAKQQGGDVSADRLREAVQRSVDGMDASTVAEVGSAVSSGLGGPIYQQAGIHYREFLEACDHDRVGERVRAPVEEMYSCIRSV